MLNHDISTPVSLFKIKRITSHSYHFATLIFDFLLQKVTLLQFALVTQSFTTKKIRLEAVRCSCILIQLLILQVSNELTFMLSAHTKQK